MKTVPKFGERLYDSSSKRWIWIKDVSVTGYVEYQCETPHWQGRAQLRKQNSLKESGHDKY